MIGRRALALCAPLVLVGGLVNLGAVSAAPPARSGVTWYRTWNEAQAVARAEGKVVLASSTRAGCGLCDRFRNETVPQCAGQLAQVAVGYLYDISRPEMWQVDRTIRAKLPGARLMPLVGFLTPDMEWVHGFWGGRTAQQLLSDVDYVRRVRPMRAVAPPVPAPAPVAQPRASTPPATPPPSAARAPATTQAPVTQAPVAARPPAAPAPTPAAGPQATSPWPAPAATPPAAPAPSVAEAPAPRVEPTPAPAPAAPKSEPAAPPNVPAAPAPQRGPLARAGSACPLGGFAAPSPNPTHEECCPGGICDVPSLFEGPDCGPLPPPSSRRLMAGEPSAAAPTPAFPVHGVPDTGALRRAIPSATDGSPDGDGPAPAARPAIARSFPPPTPAPAPEAATPFLAPASAPRVSSTIVRPEPPNATSTAAADAAAAGDWCLVLKLTKGSTDPRLMVLERRARQWAQDELNRCLNEVLAGHPESALEGLRQLKVAMAGEPAGVDAEHGIDAVETARDLRRLTDPSSVLARSLRRNKYDELRGTRWARLFEGA